MKLSEMRGMEEEAAREKIAELRAELTKERAVVAGGTRPENPGRIGNIRRNIARLLTVIREKELKKEAVEKEKKAAGKKPAAKGRKGKKNRR